MLNIRQVMEFKDGKKLVMLTAYDYIFGRLIEKAGADIALVGDTLGMVFNGYKTTLPVTVDEMIYHGKAVRNGAANTFLTIDMPFMSYQASLRDAKTSAGRIMKQTGAQAVKAEGGAETAATIKAMVDIGIPVMGHIGTQPQSVNKYGGYIVSGASDSDRQRLIKDALAIEKAGVFCMVLEKVKAETAAEITKAVSIPTISIGAGPDCDGQVLVTYDLLGLFEDFKPGFVKRYEKLAERSRLAIKKFIKDVRARKYPGKGYYY
jgi:3-methyl-2-oxobutanoate hydroxymethyltransferase